MYIRAGFKAEEVTIPPNYSSQVSPDEKYVAKVEDASGKDKDAGNSYVVNVYHKRKSINIQLGKLIYAGEPVLSLPMKSRVDLEIKWIGGAVIEINETSYNLRD